MYFVDHKILLEKREHYDIRDVALSWFKSYLNNREQFVNLNGQRSSFSKVECGVPQGSILGPLLFLIYINDLSNISKVLDFILFADDTNIFFSHKDNILSETLNSELSTLTQWCNASKLSINFKKSNYMIFLPRQKRQRLDMLININTNKIERVKETVFLGVILDENLSWIPHISNVTRKIAKSIRIIYKSSFCLQPSFLRTLYYSLVYPYLMYCVTVWGSTYKSNLLRIVLVQKKAIRILSKVSFDSHTDPLFKQHGILTIQKIYLSQIGNFMFRFSKGLLPNSFSDMFKLTNQMHSYSTRKSHKFFIFLSRTNLKQFSIRFRGPKFFNLLPLDIVNCNSISFFNIKLKEFLLS